jgi:hypothetical protein
LPDATATLDAAASLDAPAGLDGADESPDVEPLMEAPGGNITGYGFVEFDGTKSDGVIAVQTTLTVPSEPPPSGTLFLWPGIQPTWGASSFNPIGNGVLQPVLTWGNSCAPGTQPKAYSTWWVSAQYVNTYGSPPGYMGCYGGPVMSVAVGDTLVMTMTLAGTAWKQTVRDTQRGTEVSFDEDLKGQAQGEAEWVIEEYSSAPVSDVLFTDTTITFASGDRSLCKLVRRGIDDFVSTPVASSDGKTCFIEQMILRAKGIPADQ